MTAPNEKWLTLSQAAELLGIHPTTLRRWADNGDIPVQVTPGGHRRFLEADLRAHIKRPAIPDLPPPEQTIMFTSADTLPTDHEERAWADFALVETRQRLVNQPEPHWLTAFDEEHRGEKRELGRRLMALLMQHISAPDDERGLLLEARSIATRYAQNCVSVGLSAAQSLEATTFFRDTMTEVALQMPQMVQLENDAQLRILRKLNQVFNIVQVSVIEFYDRVSNADGK